MSVLRMSVILGPWGVHPDSVAARAPRVRRDGAAPRHPFKAPRRQHIPPSALAISELPVPTELAHGGKAPTKLRRQSRALRHRADRHLRLSQERKGATAQHIPPPPRCRRLSEDLS